MAVISRAALELGGVAVFAVAATAVPIGFNVARPSFSLAPPELTGPKFASGGRDYPIRFELPPIRPLARGDLAVEFDLSDSASAGEGGGSPVEIRKAVRLNGAEAGSATIRVGADSTLAISAEELSALLERAGRDDLSAQIRGLGVRFVGFEELRRLGIDVRYDAAADRIVISG